MHRFLKVLTQTSENLFKERKAVQKKLKEAGGFVDIEGKFKSIKKIKLGKKGSINPSPHCVCSSNENIKFLSARNLTVVDPETGKVLSVTEVPVTNSSELYFCSKNILVSIEGNNIEIFNHMESEKEVNKIGNIYHPLVSVENVVVKAHPSEKYLVVMFLEEKKLGIFSIYENDMENFGCFIKFVRFNETPSNVEFHVDGALLGVKFNNTCKVFSLTDFEEVLSVESNDSSLIWFSENGYHMHHGNQVLDLRKQENVYTFDESVGELVGCNYSGKKFFSASESQIHCFVVPKKIESRRSKAAGKGKKIFALEALTIQNEKLIVCVFYTSGELEVFSVA
eukprot:maker-scaffold_36-snap-gene-2.3-mRNA-1 protein AED:0.01 eAED:0.01 QI:340/1/1/1/1/1/2/67/337